MKGRIFTLFLALCLISNLLIGCKSELASESFNTIGQEENETEKSDSSTSENKVPGNSSSTSTTTTTKTTMTTTTTTTTTTAPPVTTTIANDVLSGKRALFVGDSICAGYGDSLKTGWAGRIASSTGLISVNRSVSGTSVSDVRKKKQGIIVDQLNINAEFDYVILEGGANDAWSKAKIGKMTDSYSLSDFDTSTLAGGLETLLYTAIQKFGDKARIGYLINFKAPKCEKGYISQMDDYVEMTKKICDKWGVQYFDMYNHQEITERLKFDTKLNTKDYIHPNDSGYDILSPYIAQFMRTLTPCSQETLDLVK